MALGLVMPLARYRATDANGDPLPGATLSFYLAGTTTPTDVYTTSANTTPHAWPVVADASGLFPAIYLSQSVSYKVVLATDEATVVWSQDNVSLPLLSDLEAVQAGGIAISGQVANDIIYATSATQLGRLASVAHAALVTGAAGIPAFQAGAVRRLSNNVTPVGNVTTGETDLMSYTIPAATLAANGMGLEVVAIGKCLGTEITRTIKAYLGTTVLFNSTVSGTLTGWTVRLTIMRTGAATEIVFAVGSGFTSVGTVVQHTEGTVDLAAAAVLKITGKSSGTTNDITQTGMRVLLVS